MTATYTSESTGADVLVTGRRIAATLIDVVVLGGAYALVAAVTGAVHTAGPWNWVADTSPMTSVLYAIGVAAYFIVMEVRFGQTVGKMLTGIRVIDEWTGTTPDVGRQRLGDMAGHTLVVRA
jgi:uncharacterized RDD family membrane protein YckC